MGKAFTAHIEMLHIPLSKTKQFFQFALWHDADVGVHNNAESKKEPDVMKNMLDNT